MSQRQLADRLGVSQQLVSRVESGRGSFVQLVNHCKALGVPLKICIGDCEKTVVHPLDPEEREAIEANIDWFSRLEPAERLRTIARHVGSARRLQEAARHGM